MVGGLARPGPGVALGAGPVILGGVLLLTRNSTAAAALMAATISTSLGTRVMSAPVMNRPIPISSATPAV
jgi:hypothetical protein